MTESQTGKPHPKKRWPLLGRLEIDEAFLLVLITLSVVGMAVTDAAPDLGLWFWLILVPVYGGMSLYIQWLRGRESTLGWSGVLRLQIMHWLGLLLAIQIAYLLLYMGRLNYENTGYVVALMLALTTYLSGVHLGRWRMSLAGVFLAVSVILAGWLEQYAWLFLIIAGLVIAGFSFYVKSRAAAKRRAPAPEPHEEDDDFAAS